MKSLNLVFAVVMAAYCLAASPTTKPAEELGDRRSFAVRAMAPDVPALKYQLHVDAINKVRGNAAPLYLQAMLLKNEKLNKEIEKALDGRKPGDSFASDKHVLDLLEKNKGVFDVLEVASLHQDCDWQTSMRELGFNTQMPQLSESPQLRNLLRLRCCQQIDSGNTAAAVATIRVQYAMAQGYCRDMGSIGCLVAIQTILSNAGESIADLTSRSDSPNLYWPLIDLPQLVTLREMMEYEQRWLLGQLPVLAKGRSGEITADDWLTFMTQYSKLGLPGVMQSGPEANLNNAVIGVLKLKDATDYYVRTCRVTREKANDVGASRLLAIYFIEQYQIVADEVAKISALPLPEALQRSASLRDRWDELKIDHMNPGFVMCPSGNGMAKALGRMERKFAALAAIHALRAYAADHGGHLPFKLEDVIDTPVPNNPMTGKPFDYRIGGDTATLSDLTSPGSFGENAFPLVYELKIVQP